jgi:hypothetical protein
MESTRVDSILFRDLIPSLSDSASAVLEKRLDALTAERILKSKMDRKISLSHVDPPLPSCGGASSSASVTSSPSTFFENLKGGSLASNIAFQSSSNIRTNPHNNPTHINTTQTLTQTKKPSLGLRQSTVAMLDNPKLDDLENLTNAAKKIQNVARGNRDRTLATQRREDVLTSRVMVALAQNEFVSIASTVLSDTMFNLMQEVLYGEFVIDAEPIKFLVRGGDEGMGEGREEEK